MEDYIGTILIVAACAIVLVVGALRKNAEWLINFVLRGILGTVAIYFINLALLKTGSEVAVGINLATILASGILGLPGVAALYGIVFYKTL